MGKQHTYTVKKALPHRGRILRPGEQVTLHPREAKYYIGSHLDSPAPAPKAAKKAAAKGGQPKATSSNEEVTSDG